MTPLSEAAASGKVTLARPAARKSDGVGRRGGLERGVLGDVGFTDRSVRRCGRRREHQGRGCKRQSKKFRLLIPMGI
jgi:hypothetical protein